MSQQSETATRDRIIRHALTGGQSKGVYRRHYIVSRGSPDQAILDAMVLDGLMTGPDGGQTLIGYRVTQAGAASVGLELPLHG